MPCQSSRLCNFSTCLHWGVLRTGVTLRCELSPLTVRFLRKGIKVCWCIPTGVSLYCPNEQLSPYQSQCLLLVEPKAEQWHLSKYPSRTFMSLRKERKTGIDLESRVDRWLLCHSKRLGSAFPLLPSITHSFLSQSRCLASSAGPCLLAVNTFAVSQSLPLRCTWKDKCLSPLVP